MPPETLSAPDFEARRKDKALSLTLVGMSNVGKSHWSGRLANEAGFERVNMDDLIEGELEAVLRAQGFAGGIADVAKWMGQPYEPQSPENQRRYLELEAHMMQRTIGRIAAQDVQPLGTNLVIDTTGSVVHVDAALRDEVGRHSTVVYLEATADMKQQMFERYMAEPKPVVWGDVFSQNQNETPRQALARSYPQLLAQRSILYSDMAHVTIPHDVSLEISDTDEFLDYIRDRLPAAYTRSLPYTPLHS